MMMMMMLMMMMMMMVMMSGHEEVNFRHPSAQMDDTENLTKHWPCEVKVHFPRQHIRPGRIHMCFFLNLVKDILDSVYVLTSANESGDGHADGRADL